MAKTSQDQVPPALGEFVSGDVRARAIASYKESADIHGIASPIALSRGTSVRLDGIRGLDDGGLSITTEDGATTVVDAATRTARGAEWARTSGYTMADAIQLVKAQDAGRRSVRLARQLGRETACVPVFYRDEAGVKRTGSKPVTLAPRRPTAGRGVGRAARQATNHRSAGSRRTAASSSTAGADPGDPDPEPPVAPHRLAPARAVLVFAHLTPEQRGAA